MNFKNYLFIYIFLGGCVTTPKILFEDPVDTKNKRISIQEKKIFSFEDFSGLIFSKNLVIWSLDPLLIKWMGIPTFSAISMIFGLGSLE